MSSPERPIESRFGELDAGQRARPIELGLEKRDLGVEHFGQSGDLPDLYAKYRLDSDAILDAAAAALLRRARG